MVPSMQAPAIHLPICHCIQEPLQLTWNLDQFVPYLSDVTNQIVWSEALQAYTRHMRLGP